MAKRLKGYQQDSAALVKAQERLFAAMQAHQRRLASRLVELLSELDTEGGYLLQTPANLQRMSSAVAQLRAGFTDTAWAAAVGEYVGTFERIDAGVREYVGGLGLGAVGSGALEVLRQQWAAVTLEYLTNGSNFATSLFVPMAREVGGYVATGARFTTLVRAVQGIVLGGEGLGRSEGALLGYAKTAVVDMSTTYERTALQLAADEVGASFYLYQGSTIDTTRPWCMDRAGRYFHKREVEAWGADAAGGKTWAGMIEGTNAANIRNYLGGYNCRHMLVPVARGDVPSAELDRMAAAGYIEKDA